MADDAKAEGAEVDAQQVLAELQMLATAGAGFLRSLGGEFLAMTIDEDPRKGIVLIACGDTGALLQECRKQIDALLDGEEA